MTHVLILLAIGSAGGLAAKKLKLPGGSLLGAILGAGVYSLATRSQPMPEQFRSAALVLLGISLGPAMDRETLWRVRAKLPAVFAFILVFLAASIALGLALHWFAPASIRAVTTVLGCMPGGATGSMAMAPDVGADIKVVAALHLLRQVIVFATLPLILGFLGRMSRPADGSGCLQNRA